MTTDVQRTLDFINSNFGNYTTVPQPILYNTDDAYRRDTGQTSDEIRYREGNVISASSAPPATNDPLGTEYDHFRSVGVAVRIEGLHERHGGHVTPGANQRGSDWFETELVRAVRRALLAERVWPYRNQGGTIHYHSLLLSSDPEDNLTSDERGYYRYDITVTYEGYEELP